MRIQTPEPMSNEEYWAMKCEGPALETLDHICHDCAIKTGFYIEIGEELLKQPKEVQDKALKRWYCHNNGNKACRGAHNMIRARRK